MAITSHLPTDSIGCVPAPYSIEACPGRRIREVTSGRGIAISVRQVNRVGGSGSMPGLVPESSTTGLAGLVQHVVGSAKTADGIKRCTHRHHRGCAPRATNSATDSSGPTTASRSAEGAAGAPTLQCLAAPLKQNGRTYSSGLAWSSDMPYGVVTSFPPARCPA